MATWNKVSAIGRERGMCSQRDVLRLPLGDDAVHSLFRPLALFR
eukprot:SAG31_NODE_651_length_13184_cov_4.999541_3_plen_44_part_00